MSSLSGVVRILAITLFALTAACGSSRRSNARDEGSERDAGDIGRAVLRKSVTVVAGKHDTWISNINGDEWTLRKDISGLSVGGVLLFDDVAVRVKSVAARDGKTVVVVGDVELGEVFSKISLAQDFDLSNATWDTDEPGAVIEKVEVGSEKAPNYERFEHRLKLPIPFDWDAPVSAETSLGLGGSFDFDFDGDDGMGPRGHMEMTVGLENVLSIHQDASVTFFTREHTFTTPIKIPITIGVFDSALRALGVRAAEIEIPIGLGVEAELSAAMQVPAQLVASVAATGSVHYDSEHGMSLSGDVTPDFGFELETPTHMPMTNSTVDARVGLFVRVRPQLKVLNGVGSLGLSLKVGGYGHGNISSYVIPPPLYFCYSITPEVQAEVSGTFEALGFSEQESDPKQLPLWEGDPFVTTCPEDAGVPDASADAAPPGMDGDAGSAPAGMDAALDAGDAAPFDGALADGSSPVTGSARLDQSGAPQVRYDGVVVGDPHLRTLDGVRYDMQAVGELVLVDSEAADLEIQVRTKPYRGSRVVSVVAGVATRVGNDRFNAYLDGSTRVNGELVSLPQGQTTLPGGLKVYRAGATYVLVATDGSQLRFLNYYGFYFGVEVALPDARQGRVHGLLGNFDRNAASELQPRNGPPLGDSASLSYFYSTYVESWRVSQAESLFDYAPGETTETFTDRGFPQVPASAARLDAATRAAAAQVCAQAGVSADWNEACVVDVGYTGDASFATGFVGLPAVASTIAILPDPGPGNQLDPADGAEHGTLTQGQTQSYAVSLQANQSLLARLVDTSGNSFAPRIVLYDLNNTVQQQTSAADVAALTFRASAAGQYRIEVSDASGRQDIVSTYNLYFAVTPGANEGGALTSASEVAGTLDLGDLDSYTFAASAGQGVQVRVADLNHTSFAPAFAIYDAAGTTIVSTSGVEVAGHSFTATSSGTFTIVVFDYSSGYASSGSYRLYLTVAPGANEGGALTSASEVAGTLDLGDLDSYTFAASTGQGVQVRVADLNHTSFVPAFAIYDAAGTTIVSTSGVEVAGHSFTATSSGSFTIVVFDYSSGYASSGSYRLYLTVAPGANEGGALTSASEVAGTLDLGDLDSYTFAASTGQGVQVRVADLNHTSFAPAFAIYDAAGTTIVSTSGVEVAGHSFTATSSGSFTIVVFDYSSGYASSGSYKLYLTVAPSANEGGTLTPGSSLSGTIDSGDLDSYTLVAQASNRFQITVSDANASTFVPALSVYAPSGALVGSTSGGDQANLTFTAQTGGTFMVLIYDYSSGYASSGVYQLSVTSLN